MEQFDYVSDGNGNVLAPPLKTIKSEHKVDEIEFTFYENTTTTRGAWNKTTITAAMSFQQMISELSKLPMFQEKSRKRNRGQEECKKKTVQTPCAWMRDRHNELSAYRQNARIVSFNDRCDRLLLFCEADNNICPLCCNEEEVRKDYSPKKDTDPNIKYLPFNIENNETALRRSIKKDGKMEGKRVIRCYCKGCTRMEHASCLALVRSKKTKKNQFNYDYPHPKGGGRLLEQYKNKKIKDDRTIYWKVHYSDCCASGILFIYYLYIIYILFIYYIYIIQILLIKDLRDK